MFFFFCGSTICFSRLFFRGPLHRVIDSHQRNQPSIRVCYIRGSKYLLYYFITPAYSTAFWGVGLSTFNPGGFSGPPTKLTRQKSQSYGGLANLLSFRKGWCSGFMTCWFSRVELVMFGQLVNNSATFILAGQCKCPFDGLYSSEPAIHVHHINSID